MVGSLMRGDTTGAAGAGGRLAGGLGGAALGATVGSAIPGIGTLIGGGIGGLAGSLGGEELLRKIADWFSSDDRPSEVGGEVTVRFENTPPGMRVSEVSKKNPNVDLNVDVGPMMVMP